MDYSPAHVFVRDHLLSVTFLHTVFYILWSYYLETTATGNYLVMHARLDELIPFLLVFAVPHLLWFIYIFAVLFYFSRADKDEATDLCLLLSLGMTTTFFIYTVFPNGTSLRIPVDPANGFFASLVRMIQSTDTSTNVLPSIHIFNALAVHIAVTWSRLLAHHLPVRCASLVLTLLICLPIVFLKQHSVPDVSGILLLGYFVNVVVYGSYEVPALIPAGADALFRRKKDPTKAYRQFRKKQKEMDSLEAPQTLPGPFVSVKTVEPLCDFIARNADFSVVLVRQIHALSEEAETNAEAESRILLF